MFRSAVFTNGGVVLFDRNKDAVPTSVLNELIVKECIDTSQQASSQTQLRLGKNGEFAARLRRDAETGTNAAFIFPASLRIVDAEQSASDLLKIYQADPEKLVELANLRLDKVALVDETSSKASKSAANSVRSAAAQPPKPAASEKGAKAKKNGKAKKTKKNRKWDGASDSDSDVVLDYSNPNDESQNVPAAKLDAQDLGRQSKQGFVVKELDSELSDILDDEKSETTEQFGFLKKFIGGKRLTDADLDSALQAMEDHLVMKNVAKDVAHELCDSVKQDLVGTSTRSWTSVQATVRASLKRVLARILTPSTSTDLLAQINSVHRKPANGSRRPYVISVVGVNGVGKSTNLGKLAFWFLQNDFKVLVAACDTFRSGAVEQLKVHVQRLNQLKSNGEIELFDQGYGKDAAVIAKHAVEYGTRHDFDVVLIDTAGRRHNDDRLMSSLEKFGSLANPDKIIMVGEALVGTDSVEQARNFDAAFGRGRHLDFFLISKCDTVGEMLGALVNVTYATGVPVLFVGVGQQYTDLRTLSVEWAVDKLLS